MLGIAARFSVHFSRRVLRSSYVGLPVTGVHVLFGNKSVTAASIVMVLLMRVGYATAVRC